MVGLFQVRGLSLSDEVWAVHVEKELVIWLVKQCSFIQPRWSDFSWFLLCMRSKGKKLRFPWCEVKLMTWTVWRKNLEENSATGMLLVMEGVCRLSFLQGLWFGSAFSSILEEFMVMCFFLPAYKCLPYFSEIKTLTEWLMFFLSFCWITTMYCWSRTVPFTFPFASYYFSS